MPAVEGRRDRILTVFARLGCPPESRKEFARKLGVRWPGTISVWLREGEGQPGISEDGMAALAARWSEQIAPCDLRRMRAYIRDGWPLPEGATAPPDD